jgi:hypothetical protein
MKKFNLRWAPHPLDKNQKVEWPTVSQELPAMLHSDRVTRFHNVITASRCWFFWYSLRDSISA